MAGAATPHGLLTRPMRFSLSMRPQLGAGGCRPKPMKLRPAMITMDQVMRRPVSTMSGVTRLGTISPRMILKDGRRMSSMALTWSFSQMSRAAERMTLATWGACVAATATTTSHSLGPAMLTSSRAKTMAGKARMMSTMRMIRPSRQPR